MVLKTGMDSVKPIPCLAPTTVLLKDTAWEKHAIATKIEPEKTVPFPALMTTTFTMENVFTRNNVLLELKYTNLPKNVFLLLVILLPPPNQPNPLNPPNLPNLLNLLSLLNPPNPNLLYVLPMNT